MVQERPVFNWPTNRKSYVVGTIFNDLERPQKQILRSRHYLTLNVSETTRDTDTVTMN